MVAQTKTVVFTGPAHDKHGSQILRDTLKEVAEACGFKVQGPVQATTSMLVASRRDTVKAKTALKRGLTVLTYPEFLALLIQGDSPVPSLKPAEGRKPNPWVDGPGTTMKALMKKPVVDYTRDL